MCGRGHWRSHDESILEVCSNAKVLISNGKEQASVCEVVLARVEEKRNPLRDHKGHAGLPTRPGFCCLLLLLGSSPDSVRYICIGRPARGGEERRGARKD